MMQPGHWLEMSVRHVMQSLNVVMAQFHVIGRLGAAADVDDWRCSTSSPFTTISLARLIAPLTLL